MLKKPPGATLSECYALEELLYSPTLDRPSLDFSGFYHDDGQVSSTEFASVIGDRAVLSEFCGIPHCQIDP